MLFQYQITRVLFLSFIVAVGCAHGASSTQKQNPDPHGIGGLGTIQIKYPEGNELGQMRAAEIKRYKVGQPRINHLPKSSFVDFGTEYGSTSRQTDQSFRQRSVNDFLSVLQRNTAGRYPLPSSFGRNLIWAGGIPILLAYGIKPYIEDLEARKKVYIAGLAAAVGLGFACWGLYRLHVSSAQTEQSIIREAVTQHNRFVDDKKFLFADVIDKALKNPVEGDSAHTYIKTLCDTKRLVNNVLDAQKISTATRKKPHPDILQEVRTAYLQAQAPAYRAYIAGGLVGGLSGLCALRQAFKQ